MSVTFFWLTSYPESREIDSLRPLWEEALSSASVPMRSKYMLHRWRTAPESILPVYDPVEGCYWQFDQVDFVGAFDLEPFRKVAWSILSEDSEIQYHLHIDESNSQQLLALSRNSPMAVLWYALGANLAERLPGYMGNILANPGEVKRMKNEVDEIFSKVDEEAMLQRAKSFVDETYSKEVYLEIFANLRDGLDKATKTGSGYLSICMRQ